MVTLLSPSADTPGMTQIRLLGSQLVSRLALAFVLALLFAAWPSLTDAWHDGGPVQVVLRAGYVMVRVIGELVGSLA